MAGWTDNPIMEWSKTPTGMSPNWFKISDHGRSELSVSTERIENKSRIADGSLRRHVIAKKRTWTASWENFPSKASDFLANGQPGEWMQQFHDDVDGSFWMKIRAGDDINRATELVTDEVEVVISEFSKGIIKRGPAFDLWSLDITLEEV